MNEKYLENKIKKYLKDNNYYHFKFFANSHTKSGVPDIIACVNGRFIGIEVKNPNGKGVLSPLQQYNIDFINKSGGYAVVIDNYNDFLNFIKEIEKI